MNIEAKKISIIQQILNIDDISFIKELEVKIAQLLPKYQTSSNEEKMTEVNTTEQKPVTALSEEESILLLKINEGFPPEIQKRYNDLSAKSVHENLTEAEHQELLELIPRVESKSVERLKYLVELSLLWDMSVDAVMEKLEIKTPPVIHV